MNNCQSYRQGFEQGKIDYLNNTKVSNPYTKGTINFENWLDGWVDGQEQAAVDTKGDI